VGEHTGLLEGSAPASLSEAGGFVCSPIGSFKQEDLHPRGQLREPAGAPTQSRRRATSTSEREPVRASPPQKQKSSDANELQANRQIKHSSVAELRQGNHVSQANSVVSGGAEAETGFEPDTVEGSRREEAVTSYSSKMAIEADEQQGPDDSKQGGETMCSQNQGAVALHGDTTETPAISDRGGGDLRGGDGCSVIEAQSQDKAPGFTDSSRSNLAHVEHMHGMSAGDVAFAGLRECLRTRGNPLSTSLPSTSTDPVVSAPKPAPTIESTGIRLPFSSARPSGLIRATSVMLLGCCHKKGYHARALHSGLPPSHVIFYLRGATNVKS
jgi:hypothetical protein